MTATGWFNVVAVTALVAGAVAFMVIWTGAAPKPQPCPTCGGTGFYPEDSDGIIVDRYGCPDCGTGGA